MTTDTLTISLNIADADIHPFAPRTLEHFYQGDIIRAVERASIRWFMQKHQSLLTGNVLDFGAGKEPYRDLVTGNYSRFDRADYLTEDAYEMSIHRIPLRFYGAIMCNQVLQYIPNPLSIIGTFYRFLVPGGHLVMTYPLCWDEVESSDLQRLTKFGMESLLTSTGFTILDHHRRAEVRISHFTFPLGYGVLARKPE